MATFVAFWLAEFSPRAFFAGILRFRLKNADISGTIYISLLFLLVLAPKDCFLV